MADILPQQRLLLERLALSGDIAMPELKDDTVLARTLGECEIAGWVRLREIGAGYRNVAISAGGRTILDRTP